MREFFGTPWNDLTADDVEAFLADAGDEGLTWEAKGGGRPPRKDSIRKGVCGLANAVGGMFIIGAERTADGWTLPGVSFETEEPGTWLSSVISDGLSPTPFFDIKMLDRAGGLSAAVVAVEELAVPPCVTTSGVVYQRVSGQTLPVMDQRVLTDLIERGRTARAEAEARAVGAGLRALEEPIMLEPQQAMVSVALCPVQGPDDKASVLFSKTFALALSERVNRDLQPEPPLRYPTQLTVRQDSVRASSASRELGKSWTVKVYWDGSVSAVYASLSTELYVGELVARVQRAWKVLVGAAADLGGRGSAHLVVTIHADNEAVAAQRVPPTTPARRWTELRGPTEDELAAVERELRRGFGEAAWEPEEKRA